ncbi:uncharacterized protein LOC100256179 [Vitis vinifera]|uniref:DPL2 protein n=3 Tax=Vitis vinifera TaxID=29760 RepID=F6HEH7_VITVI|nr:uncharacterized protein LOC100256179 [Vitis vinifera]XP_010662152.1 uncharacterized protein LOC100256179 [Vitis vinifera]XP_019081401.1 uncharacterized protein LOC100256179 [Vitis vinifera]RVW41783.1 hypothetical protein CK203_107204 [Vitis vinifera]|eukprot:XP_002278482.1 PREDICTED: uncharacterized protein LOC100256179 [Vitis vinifera]
MGTEEPKKSLKGMEWIAMDDSVQKEASGKPVIKKRLPKRVRQIPEFYFLPRRSLPANIALYGSIIAAGVGAGMLVEIWIKKKIAEDGDTVLWELK